LEDGVVDSSSIEKESADDLLESLDTLVVERVGGIGGHGGLCRGSVHRSLPRVRRVLAASRGRMVEAFEGSFDITGHGNVAGTGDVIPVYMELEELRARPVFSGTVQHIDGVEQMLRMFASDVLDAETESVDRTT